MKRTTIRREHICRWARLIDQKVHRAPGCISQACSDIIIGRHRVSSQRPGVRLDFPGKGSITVSKWATIAAVLALYGRADHICADPVVSYSQPNHARHVRE